MTQTPEFRAQYLEGYGRYGRGKPDFTRCADTVHSGDVWSGSSQCSRKNGHGPHGAWCKQHDPVAVKARDDARRAKWEAKWAEEKRKSAFQRECQDAIRKIAAGHNDPRWLAQEILDRMEGEG